MQNGRAVLFTDALEINADNVGEIVAKAMEQHLLNVKEIENLIDFEKGKQPILRTKKYRSDIDCQCVDNVANEITDFKLSYNWGNPITLVMREKDNDDVAISKAVTELNKCFEAQNYKSKQQELARYVEICGVGYVFIDVNTDYEEGESPFTIDVLDPRCAFIVRSSYYLDKRVMLAVSFYCASDGTKHYTCFTKDSRYELDNLYEHEERSGEVNPLGIVPIVEWFRSYDRMGCFERQVSEMNNLNLLISDFTNDVEQNTQAVWHTNDVEFPKEIVKNDDGTETERVRKPKSSEWLGTFTSKDGKQPFIKALSIDYDYTGMLNNIITRRNLILQKCNVPSRNDNKGGSTGIAMSDATGWTQAEVEANRQDQIKDACKMQEIKIALKAIKICKNVSPESPLLVLRYTDVKPSIKRQKTYEMTTKINAYATGVSHGINYKDMLNVINLFDDPQQVAENSKETTELYLKSILSGKNEAVGGTDEAKPNADRLEQDKSDQIENSPSIDGMKTKQ